MKKLIKYIMCALVMVALTVLQAEAQGRGNRHGGGSPRTSQPRGGNQGSRPGGNPGNNGRPASSRNEGRPTSHGASARKDNGSKSQPVADRPTAQRGGNHGGNPGGGKGSGGNNGNPGGNRPGMGNQPGGNHGNNGGHPGVGNRHPGTRPGGNVNPPGNPGPRPRPNAGPTPRPGGGWGPSRGPIAAPPYRPNRPVYAPWSRPTPPPRGWRPGPGCPVIGTILGIAFGATLDYTLSYLAADGYYIDGYSNGLVYLCDVNQYGFLWPNATLYYNSGGCLAGSEFFYSTPYADPYRYRQVYNHIYGMYGPPTVTVGNQLTWYGNNCYITLNYSQRRNEYGNYAYFTTLTFGQ